VPNEPSHNPVRDQAVAWFFRLQAYDVSADERRDFLRWLNENPGHRQAYEAIDKHWRWLEPLKSMPFPAREEAVNFKPKATYRISAYAAAAVITLSVGFSVYWQQTGIIFPKTYEVAKGDRQTIKLADGSIVELNTGSKVKVNISPWRRDLELLQGEAFFQVKHDSERPFRVRAGHGLITDIGTAFEVYRHPDKVLVAVQEGVVDVKTLEQRRLTANQQLAYTNNGDFIVVQEQPVASLTAWRHGQLVFHARRLDDVLAEMARYHNKQIRLEDSKLAALRISGAFPSDRLDSMLNAVARILPVRVEREGGDNIVIRQDAKTK